jgi:hypothetical protein
MQMRLNRHNPVKGASEARANYALGDGFPRGKDGILTHIGQVGRNQRNTLSTGPAEGIGGKERLDQFGVGMVQRPH